MAEQPTRGAESETVESWKKRGWVARIVWMTAVLFPPVASGAGTWMLRGLFWQPAGAFGIVIWIAQVGAVGLGIVFLCERLVRRVIPLTHLLRLTLVFPDQAPSRYSVALRSGTIRQQQAVIDSVQEHGFSDDEVKAFEQLVVMVMALGRHERLTRGHTERVRAYTDLLAAEMGLPAADREKLHWAALLHDIGKLGVPAEVLSLPGKPDEAQWAQLKAHPAIGAEMVERFADWLGPWRLAAGQHHERWDGGGYPNGLAGLDISLAGRIVAIADAYDVITSSRSYKKAMSAEAARAELVRCAGDQFDPVAVRAFLRISTGDLRAVTGRLAWTSSLPGIAARAGQAVSLPLTAAAGIIGLPLMAASVGLADEIDPFALLARDVDEVSIVELADEDPGADDELAFADNERTIRSGGNEPAADTLDAATEPDGSGDLGEQEGDEPRSSVDQTSPLAFGDGAGGSNGGFLEDSGGVPAGGGTDLGSLIDDVPLVGSLLDVVPLDVVPIVDTVLNEVPLVTGTLNGVVEAVPVDKVVKSVPLPVPTVQVAPVVEAVVNAVPVAVPTVEAAPVTKKVLAVLPPPPTPTPTPTDSGGDEPPIVKSLGGLLGG